MTERARERRKGKRAADRALLEQKAKADRTLGCVTCGRGELPAQSADLVVTLDGQSQRLGDINSKLVLVPCSDALAHMPPTGRHIGRCGGWVYQHENRRLCAAVMAQGRAAVAAIARGAN